MSILVRVKWLGSNFGESASMGLWRDTFAFEHEYSI
ncbi:hypothetical protein BW21_2407 [Burkholderia humptydooensis]|nr:hypothetical protein BW21_2407 [Burkholderia sp. 2002721687]